MTERIGKYLRAEREPEIANGDQHRWAIRTRRGALLGIVAWYPNWGAYELQSTVSSGFTSECLRDIAAFLERKTAEHREGAKT